MRQILLQNARVILPQNTTKVYITKCARLLLQNTAVNIKCYVYYKIFLMFFVCTLKVLFICWKVFDNINPEPFRKVPALDSENLIKPQNTIFLRRQNLFTFFPYDALILFYDNFIIYIFQKKYGLCVKFLFMLLYNDFHNSGFYNHTKAQNFS